MALMIRHSGGATFTEASTKPASESTALGGIAFTGCDVFGKLLSLYRLLKGYLKHFGVLLTALVIILACSLRGELIIIVLYSGERGKREGSSELYVHADKIIPLLKREVFVGAI
jgi:hypothetical protein